MNCLLAGPICRDLEPSGPPDNVRVQLHNYLPSSGTASEVAGIVSATMLRKTVSDSRIVTPGKTKKPESNCYLSSHPIHHSSSSLRPGQAGRLTERKLLARVRRQNKTQQRHRGDKDTGHDQVEKVVQSFAADQNGERYVDVGLWAAVIVNLVPLAGHPCNTRQGG